MDVMDSHSTEKHAENTESGLGQSPLLAVWFRTKEAVLHACRTYPEEYIHRLYMVTGLMFMLAIRIPDWLAVEPNPIGVMIQILLVGPVGGIVTGYLYSAVLRMVARWFGSELDSKFAKCGVAWTQVPFLAFWTIILVVYLALNGSQAVSHPKEIWAFDGFMGWLPLIVAMPVLLWGMVVRVRGIAAIFGFPTLRAFWVWLVTVFLAYVPALALIVVYSIIYYITASDPN